jgi:hypothetical protein
MITMTGDGGGETGESVDSVGVRSSLECRRRHPDVSLSPVSHPPSPVPL